MEVPGPPVSSKPGETSVKWQLCYDMTAKMWWMVSAEVPTGARAGACAVIQGQGDSGQRVGRPGAWTLEHRCWGVQHGWQRWQPQPGHSRKRKGETESRQWTGKPLLSLVAGRVSEAPQAECVSVWAGAGCGRACGRPLSGKVGHELAGPGGLAMAQPRFAVAPGPAKQSGECVRSRGAGGVLGGAQGPGPGSRKLRA